MWKRLIIVWIAVSSAFASLPCPDGYDTLYFRGRGYTLVPKYDTIKQLDTANKKADQILENLEEIMSKLNIKDTIK